MRRYRDRVSGPLLDRIDLQVEVPRPPEGALRPDRPRGEASATVRRRVERARTRQLERAGRLNATLDTRGVARHCDLPERLWDILDRAAKRFRLSPRACHRILKVARTTADLDGEDAIGSDHLLEAISLRRPSRAPQD